MLHLATGQSVATLSNSIESIHSNTKWHLMPSDAVLAAPAACTTQVLFVQGRNVLKKEPMGKDIRDKDVFSFNEDFTNKLYKIKIATVSAQKENEPEKQDTRHKVRVSLTCT